jgi:hypothetical protein
LLRIWVKVIPIKWNERATIYKLVTS